MKPPWHDSLGLSNGCLVYSTTGSDEARGSCVSYSQRPQLHMRSTVPSFRLSLMLLAIRNSFPAFT